MATITRPMLASTVELSGLGALRYPLLASPKLDGIRCIVHPELGPVTRQFKAVPNRYVYSTMKEPAYEGLDGELLTFNEEGWKLKDFNSIQSDIMTQAGEPRFEFWVFDYITEPTVPFTVRCHRLRERYNALSEHNDIIVYVAHQIMNTPEEVQAYSAECLEGGFEGIILRDPQGPYKSGRSTLKQQWMLKLKEFHDAEGTIKGFEELYRNRNPQERDAFGLAERSDKKEGMVPAGTLGALVLDTKWGELKLGTGFDYALRDHIWQSRANLVGRVVTFKYQPFGMQALPRFPVFMRFRED